jgi:hypothetical protein
VVLLPDILTYVAFLLVSLPCSCAAAVAAAAAREAAGAAGKAPVVSAAAGAAWRVRALQRAQQLAKEQGRELNEVGLLQASHRTADAGCPCPESMLCSRCIM